MSNSDAATSLKKRSPTVMGTGKLATVVALSCGSETLMVCGVSCGDIGLAFRGGVFFFQAEDGIRDFHVLEFRRVLFRSDAHAGLLDLVVELDPGDLAADRVVA